MKSKIKSSALLIAIIIGIVLMTSSIGVAVLTTQHTRLAGQARDGKIAYRAALSGIDDGLLRYKYARASSNMTDFWKIKKDKRDISDDVIRPPKASYELSINSSSLSQGGETNLSQKMNLDDTTDIDLSPYLPPISSEQDRVTKVRIYFSAVRLNGVDQSGFTALNVRLVDVSKLAESQLIEEFTNINSAANSVDISKIGQCGISSQCHIKIRPQMSKGIIGPSEARRIRGEVTPAAGTSGKYINYAIVAYNGAGVIDPTGSDQPGTIIISSVGIAGQARHKIEAKIDASSGAYLGLFDYGIYCGSRCDWGSNGI